MMMGMAVTVRVGAVTMRLAMVVMARRRRHMMIGAQRAVHGEGKRGHDRESGRNTSAHQLGETNHPGTGITLHWRAILIAGFLPVQIDDATPRANCAYLVAFGKIPDSETGHGSKPLGNQHHRLSIEHPEKWPKSSSCLTRM
jgi:hypothetical protein